MGKKKGSRGKDYFGMSRLVSIIFAIIPITSWLFGFVTRFQEGKIVAGLLCMLFQGKILRLLNF